MNNDNIDTDEITKFNQMAARWWDMEGDFGVLHNLNPLRIDYIEGRVGLKGQKILDVGCGGGILSEGMAHRGANVTGIDAAEGPLQVARLHGIESGVAVEYRCTTAEALAGDEAGLYDVVTCLEMLEHVPVPAVTVAACASLVKPGGSCFFSTINRNPKSWLFAIAGAEHLLRILPKGTHDYDRFIRPSELDVWGRDAGLNLEAVQGFAYNPLTRHFRLTSDVDVNYISWMRRT